MSDRVGGMAPTPEQMERIRSVQQAKPTPLPEKKKGKGRRKFVRVTVDPSLRGEVQQILFGTHWMFQKRILDILRIVTDAEKWETVRNIVMDIENEQIETQRAMIGRRITDYLAQEKSNGHDGSTD